jgi:hypothetical protein
LGLIGRPLCFAGGFLDRANQQVQAAGGATQHPQQQQPISRGPSEVAQRIALLEFSVRESEEAGGAVIDLVDIGANLQGRYSHAAMVRQLQRAAYAGVRAVILTGCDLEGSRKGAEACESWLQQQTQAGGEIEAEDSAVEMWTTSGCHPHDASKIASVSLEDGCVVVSQPALEALQAMAVGRFCVAVGECGLDYDRMFSPREVQLAVFEAQVALAA